MLSLFVVLWKHRQEHNYGLVVMTQAPCKTPQQEKHGGSHTPWASALRVQTTDGTLFGPKCQAHPDAPMPFEASLLGSSYTLTWYISRTQTPLRHSLASGCA